MKQKTLYFLIARDRDSNHIEVIPVKEDWGDSLENIDLFTTTFEKEQDLTNYFIETGEIHSINTDFFIAHRALDENNQSVLKLEEVLWHEDSKIKDIAKAASSGDITKAREAAQLLINAFCNRMKQDSSFYDRMIYQDTNLYPKFIRYFLDRKDQDTYDVKYKDGAWTQKSYPLLRNIIYNLNHEKKEEPDRKLLKDRLYQITRNEFYPGQGLLFEDGGLYGK